MNQHVPVNSAHVNTSIEVSVDEFLVFRTFIVAACTKLPWRHCPLPFVRNFAPVGFANGNFVHAIGVAYTTTSRCLELIDHDGEHSEVGRRVTRVVKCVEPRNDLIHGCFHLWPRPSHLSWISRAKHHNNPHG